QTHALRIHRQQLARHSSRHDRQNPHRTEEFSAKQTRPSGFVSTRTCIGLHRLASIWSRALSPWRPKAGLVEDRCSRNYLGSVQSNIRRSIFRSTSESNDQRRSTSTKWLLGNWQLDGGRNFVASANS